MFHKKRQERYQSCELLAARAFVERIQNAFYVKTRTPSGTFQSALFDACALPVVANPP